MYPHWTKTPETELDWFEALTKLARYLRSPDGCPWDREQSSQNFASFAAGEVNELNEAFRTGNNDHIEEELGDALFCILATAAAAEEEGQFTLRSALERIHKKMIRRHSHVFGEKKAQTPEDAVRSWNQTKEEEKADD